MEEKELTPEQEEMQVYEKYAERLGLEGAVEWFKNTVMSGAVFAKTASGALQDGTISVNDPAFACVFRVEIARLQVAMNVLQLIFGDTAEEECGVIESLKDLLR